MTLQKWFEQRTKMAFAKRIGVAPSTLSRYMAAGTAPRRKRIVIERETGGAVHRERDWPNGPPDKERKKD